jgi:DNA-binding transcriptional MocR family regulator
MRAGGFMPVPVFFLDNYHRLGVPLKNIEVLIILHLMRHKYDARAPFPSLTNIARKMSISDTAVRNHVRSLEVKGYVRREPRKAKSNAYHFDGLLERLEKLTPEESGSSTKHGVQLDGGGEHKC